jgi:hypothetical protein
VGYIMKLHQLQILFYIKLNEKMNIYTELQREKEFLTYVKVINILVSEWNDWGKKQRQKMVPQTKSKPDTSKV